MIASLRLHRTVAALAVAAIVLPTIISCAEEATVTADRPSTTTTSEDSDPELSPIPRGPRLEELILDSVAIVRGRVTEVGEGSATLEIDEVLASKDDLGDASTMQIAASTVEEGESGLWILGAGSPYEVLSPPRFTPEESITRLLEGKPRVAPPPTAAEIQALAARADAIVFARIDATAPDQATISVETAIEGTVEAGAQVSRADGQEWTLPQEAPSYGVLFLVRDGEQWVAINDQQPSAYRVTPVREALG